jgi:hypothetical protein
VSRWHHKKTESFYCTRLCVRPSKTLSQIPTASSAWEVSWPFYGWVNWGPGVWLKLREIEFEPQSEKTVSLQVIFRSFAKLAFVFFLLYRNEHWARIWDIKDGQDASGFLGDFKLGSR